MERLVFLVLIIYAVYGVQAQDEEEGDPCVEDSECPEGQFCFERRFSDVNVCAMKKFSGRFCLENNECASNLCGSLISGLSFLSQCRGCESDAQCHAPGQYCDSVPLLVIPSLGNVELPDLSKEPADPPVSIPFIPEFTTAATPTTSTGEDAEQPGGDNDDDNSGDGGDNDNGSDNDNDDGNNDDNDDDDNDDDDDDNGEEDDNRPTSPITVNPTTTPAPDDLPSSDADNVVSKILAAIINIGRRRRRDVSTDVRTRVRRQTQPEIFRVPTYRCLTQAGVGEQCRANNQCLDGLICAAVTLICVDPDNANSTTPGTGDGDGGTDIGEDPQADPAANPVASPDDNSLVGGGSNGGVEESSEGGGGISLGAFINALLSSVRK